MSHVSTITAARRWLPVALALALAACSGKEESAAPAPAAAPAAAAPAAPVVAAKVQSMGTEQLRESASQALRENRMYAPAGDNAIEYYLALRDKTPDDASVKSALTDLLPYTLIAAEQHLGREDYTEAQRLVALIEKVDASAPALPRLKEGLAKGVENAAKRSETEAEKAKKDAEDRTKQQAEQQRLTEQRAKEADAAKQIASQQDAARRDNERQEAERQAAARRDAEQKQQQAAANRPAPHARQPPRQLPPSARSARRRRAIRPRHCVRERRAKCWWRSPSVPTAQWSAPACCARRRDGPSTAKP